MKSTTIVLPAHHAGLCGQYILTNHAKKPVCNWWMILTHFCLASRKKALANSEDPDETPHDAASHLGLRRLLKGIYVRNILNMEINILDIPIFGNKLIQFRRMGESTRHKWVNFLVRRAIFNSNNNHPANYTI